MPEGLLILVTLSTLAAVIVGDAFHPFSFGTPALGLLPDRNAIRARRQINLSFINAWFVIPLSGPGAWPVSHNGCIRFHASIGADSRR